MNDPAMDGGRVDVVIATYNRNQRLARTLRSLQTQSVQGFGIIVVDDCSEPPVEDNLPREMRAIPGLRLLRTDRNSGPAVARNLAVSTSAADLIAFIDDDVDASPRWLEALLRRQQAGPEHVVVIGPMLAPGDWKPTAWNRWEATMLAHEYRRMSEGEYEPTWRQFFTGNALVRRDDFLAAGGFDPEFRRAEDIELALRLARAGCSFAFEPRAEGWHYAYRSKETWLANAEQYARFDVRIAERYPDLDWLGLIHDEIGRRPRAARLARRIVPAKFVPVAARGSLAMASLLHRTPLKRTASRFASLSYDLVYSRALARYASASSAHSTEAAYAGASSSSEHADPFDAPVTTLRGQR